MRTDSSSAVVAVEFLDRLLERRIAEFEQPSTPGVDAFHVGFSSSTGVDVHSSLEPASARLALLSPPASSWT
jgi:hypothetical protein